MNNKIAYILVLALIYMIYINRRMVETFKASSSKSNVDSMNDSIDILDAHIKDLAAISKHNTTTICKMKKSIASAGMS